MTVLTILFSFTQAVIFEPEGIKGHQEDPSHKEEAAISETSLIDGQGECRP